MLNSIVAVEECDARVLNKRTIARFKKIKMQRREFIKSTCNFCMLGAAGFMLPQLIGCSPAIAVYKTIVNNNQLAIPLTLFEISSIQFVRPAGWYYDIAVQKKEDNTYAAILMKCTHQENQLTKSGNGFHCSLHGSQFDATGKVRKGPAETPLRTYLTSIDQNNLIIRI